MVQRETAVKMRHTLSESKSNYNLWYPALIHYVIKTFFVTEDSFQVGLTSFITYYNTFF